MSASRFRLFPAARVELRQDTQIANIVAQCCNSPLRACPRLCQAEVLPSRQAKTLGVMIERQLGKVDDPARYKARNQSFGLAKNRSKGLPLDEAR